MTCSSRLGPYSSPLLKTPCLIFHYNFCFPEVLTSIAGAMGTVRLPSLTLGHPGTGHSWTNILGLSSASCRVYGYKIAEKL